MDEMNVAVRIAAGMVSLAAVAACGIALNDVTWKMVDLVNQRLPPNERFDHAWWWFGKELRLHREYRRLDPAAPLLRRMRRLGLAGAAALFALCLVAGFPVAGAVFVAGGLAVATWLKDRP